MNYTPTGMTEAPFVVEVAIRDGDLIVTPKGDIDMSSGPMLWDTLAEAIPLVSQRLVLDLSETTFLDSTALTVFVRAYRRLRAAGADAELILRAPSTSAEKILAITGLDQVFTIEKTARMTPSA